MADVIDVAEYVLEKTGFVSTMKLEKLVFYSNALSLVRDGCPLFPQGFQAWVNGPVCPELFRAHKRKFIIGPHELAGADASRLDDRTRGIVEKTVSVFKDYDGNALSDLTHREGPWRDAREGYAQSDHCSETIPNESIREFYSSPRCNNPLFATS